MQYRMFRSIPNPHRFEEKKTLPRGLKNKEYVLARQFCGLVYT